MKLAGTLFDGVSFASRHSAASIASILASVVIGTILYLVLLFIAIIWNAGLGSPAMPILVPLGAAVLALIYTATILFPSAVFAEFMRYRMKLPHWTEIPLSSLASFIIVLGWLVVMSILVPEHPLLPHQVVGAAAVGWLLLAVPLGNYWWSLKSAQLAMHCSARALSFASRCLTSAGRNRAGSRFA